MLFRSVHPTTAMAAVMHCARCNSSFHTTSVCPKPFYRTVKASAQDRQREYEEKHAEYLARKGAKQTKSADDAASEVSWSSVSTAATLALSLDEEREARKMEKKLRDITRLEERQAGGEVLDKLQVGKIDSKTKLEATVVMLKVRAGAVRPPL